MRRPSLNEDIVSRARGEHRRPHIVGDQRLCETRRSTGVHRRAETPPISCFSQRLRESADRHQPEASVDCVRGAGDPPSAWRSQVLYQVGRPRLARSRRAGSSARTSGSSSLAPVMGVAQRPGAIELTVI
jgi:hypothetical protein